MKRKFDFKSPKAIIVYEILGFGVILIFLWVDEIFDLPHYLFGSMKTPVNTVESLFESVMILIISIFCVGVTIHLLAKIKLLEGLLPICSSCKKIRDSHDHWQQIESYIEKHSNASFSHSICQDCIEKLYGDKEWYKKNDP